jgi:ABC-type transport system substrate-binding protein
MVSRLVNVKLAFAILASIGLLAALSCAADEPAAPSITTADVQAAVKGALADAPAAPTGPSAAEIQTMVEGAVASSMPAATDPAAIQRMVEAAVAGVQTGVSKAELEAAIRAQAGTQVTAADVKALVDEVSASVEAVRADVQQELAAAAARDAPDLDMDQTLTYPHDAVLTRGAPWRRSHGDRSHMGWTFMRLTMFDENNDTVPGLALTWDNQDNTVYTFHLDPRAVFHNGKPVTAAAIKDAWEWSIQPIHQVGTGGNLNDLKHLVGVDAIAEGTATTASGIEAVDDHTLRLTLKGPDPYFASKMARDGHMTFDVEYAKNTPDWDSHAVGVGPYQISRDLDVGSFTLTANEHWWKAPVTIQRVDYIPVTDRQTILIMYENDEADIVFASPDWQPRLHDANHPDNSHLHQVPYGGLGFHLAFNTTIAPMEDINVRKAIAHAVDLKPIIAAAFGPTAEVANGAISPTMACYKDEWAPAAFDVAMAKDLIAKSSYGSVDNLPPIKVSLRRTQYIRVGEAIQEQLKDNLGLNMIIHRYERGQSKADDSNILRVSNGSWGPSPTSLMNNIVHSQGAHSPLWTKHEDYGQDSKIEATDLLPLDAMTQRCAAWQELNEEFMSRQYIIPGIWVDYRYAVQPWVDGFGTSVNNDFYTLPTMKVLNRKDFR